LTCPVCTSYTIRVHDIQCLFKELVSYLKLIFVTHTDTTKNVSVIKISSVLHAYLTGHLNWTIPGHPSE